MKWLYSPNQLMYPLKRAGGRGENKWEKISWDQALDEIAQKLERLKAEYGAETLAVNEGTYRSDMFGIRSRFLNLFGNPSNVGGPGTVCMCNKFQMRYALTGPCSVGASLSRQLKCWVLDGYNMTQSVRTTWNNLIESRRKEIKLIVIDPRRTEVAKQADLWLQIRPGTDSALFLAWLNVIITENLYDKDFVNSWTVGFDQLRERVDEYTPEQVAEITWVPADLIRQSARMYAENNPATIEWGCATDQIGVNSMRVEHAKICLRAITGNYGRDGGEVLRGPGPVLNGNMAIRDSMLQLEEQCTPEQRNKQLGSDRFKLMTWPGYELANEAYKRTYGIPMSMSGHNFMSPQPLIWRAILSEKPYPIKAMITWTSNPLLNAANTKLVYEALKSPNLELHVVHEHFMTPTALLADYVLPAASKLEQPACTSYEDFEQDIRCGERAVEPLGERKTNYEFFRELSKRLGFGEHFPWETDEDLADYRLAPVGLTHKDAANQTCPVAGEPWTYETINPTTGKPTGFATPSGKIELSSTILEKLGYDPLPYYQEPPESPVSTPEIAKEFPLILITGGNFRPMFHSENRHFGMGTREQQPDPLMEIHPDTAQKLNITDGDWVCIETKRGAIKQKSRLTEDIHPRVVNVQSHWWFPEQPAQEPFLHGLWQSNANVLTMDDPDICDPISGGWCLRALLCKVYKP
ncbi:MAG: molybdopterin-dependent oxidoreductase [Desulfuromonadaceae bacterium]|nr:molybdopterin-dependent oxidoreductase [Desulfuromonadaceae bacterium]